MGSAGEEGAKRGGEGCLLELSRDSNKRSSTPPVDQPIGFIRRPFRRPTDTSSTLPRLRLRDSPGHLPRHKMPALPSPPNYYSYFSWLPPDIAFSSEALGVMDACCLSIITYDILCHLHFDWTRIKEIGWSRHHLSRGSTSYLAARWLTLMATLLGTVFEFIRNTGDCGATWTAFSVFFALGNAVNSLLLGLRVVAFWNKDKTILWGLGTLWCILLALNTSIAWAARGYGVFVNERQVGCTIGHIITSNGVNINIMGYSATMGYDAICCVLIFLKLWSNDGVTKADRRDNGASPQQSSTPLITPLLRRQTLITYALTFSASLAFIIVQVNPGDRLNLVASISFAVPFLTFQCCLISYMFRNLFKFTQTSSTSSFRRDLCGPRSALHSPVGQSLGRLDSARLSSQASHSSFTYRGDSVEQKSILSAPHPAHHSSPFYSTTIAVPPQSANGIFHITREQVVEVSPLATHRARESARFPR